MIISNRTTISSTLLTEKLTVTQLVKKLPAFYGTLSFITCSQEPATVPHSQPDAWSPNLLTLFP
jgi:hypothetical protein